MGSVLICYIFFEPLKKAKQEIKLSLSSLGKKKMQFMIHSKAVLDLSWIITRSPFPGRNLPMFSNPKVAQFFNPPGLSVIFPFLCHRSGSPGGRLWDEHAAHFLGFQRGQHLRKGGERKRAGWGRLGRWGSAATNTSLRLLAKSSEAIAPSGRWAESWILALITGCSCPEGGAILCLWLSTETMSSETWWLRAVCHQHCHHQLGLGIPFIP